MEHRAHETGTVEYTVDLKLQALQAKSAETNKGGKPTDLDEAIASARIQLSQGTYGIEDAENLIKIAESRLGNNPSEKNEE